MPWADSGKMGRPSESTAGSGKFGTPRERMQRAKGSMPRSRSGTSAAGNWSSSPTGSKRWQAFSAAASWELLTCSCCALGNFALLAPAWGSGKSGTPCERTQRVKATSRAFADPPASGELAGLPALDELREPVDDGLPPQAAASRARAAATMMAAAARAAGGRGRRMTRMLWLIMPSSGLDDRAGRRRRPAWMARCRGGGAVRRGRSRPGQAPRPVALRSAGSKGVGFMPAVLRQGG
jgi:hypothetical protein